LRRLGGIVTFGVLALVIASCVQVSRLSHSCVVCRLHRVDATCLGLTHSTYSETDCSRWYAAHVEPQHVHVWERGTCQYTSNLLGMPASVGCSPGRFPIMLLSPTTQMKVYQHFQAPLEAKRLFANLTDAKTHGDRLDEEDEDRGHLTVDAIEAWESAGFPGEWGEWWDRFYAKHVEEHKEWLTWLHADSGMNFWDWQKQRKRKD
jgi:hypothetical protein